MIHIVEGRIGSGKTYFVVSWILERYFIYSDRFFEFMPKEKSPTIISNIRDINLPNVLSLDQLVNDASSLEDLFCILESGDLKYPVLKNSVIIIDEAQSPKWFHRKYYNPKVMYFFQLHRHYGIDIFLCTQDVKSLCPEVRELPEYHIKAARASLQLGSFRYQKFYDNEAGERSFLKRDKRVFEAYRSVEKGAQIKKTKSVLIHYGVYAVVLVALAVFSLFLFKWYFFGGVRDAKGNISDLTVKSSVELKKEINSRDHISDYVLNKAEASDPARVARPGAKPEAVGCVVGNYIIYDSKGIEVENKTIKGECNEPLGV